MKKHDDYSLTLNDLWKLVIKKKKTIATSGILVAVFFVFYSLSKPPAYLVEGTFKEKKKASSMLNPSFAAFFSGAGSGEESEASCIMKSRRILSKVVQYLNLQAIIEKNKPGFPLARNIIDNIKVEYALFKNSKKPSLPDKPALVKATQVFYPAEVPLSITVKFISNSEYIAYDSRKHEIGRGIINEPFVQQGFSFVLTPASDHPLDSTEFALHLQSLEEVASRLSKIIKIEADKIDKNFLKIRYIDHDRHLAVDIVNAVMQSYQDFIREEQNRIAGEQIAYLEKRQKEMTESLEEIMGEHASTVSTDLRKTGFGSSDTAMQFFMGTQSRYKQKLLDIDLETSRLKSLPEVGYAYYDASHSNGDRLIINSILDKIRELKQYGDSIEVALRTAPYLSKDIGEKNFLEQLAALEEIRLYSQEASALAAGLDNEVLDRNKPTLLQNTKYTVKPWLDMIEQKKIELTQAPIEQQAIVQRDLDDLKQKFSSYLANLIHLFEVHEKIIGERLSHQQPSQNEFQGITLEIARELYLQYNQNLQNIESQLLKTRHILNAMEKPDFEISSLSTVLDDSISKEMIEKTATLALSLRDQNNRSIKEQERLKDELALQKGFLNAHLTQVIDLLDLHLNLLKDKIASLQNVTLSLIQQETSILEKHLSDYVASRFNDLKHEQELISQHQNELQTQMSVLPQKSLREKLIELRLRITQGMMEEVSKLVETKNISNSLEVVQSSPIDQAVAPLHPKPPHLILIAVVGLILGTLGSLSFILVKAIATGIDASAENLVLAQQHVAGSISKNLTPDLPLQKLQDPDLETLRHITAFFNNQKSLSLGNTLLVVKGNGIDFSHQLAALMGKTGQNVLLLPITFDAPSNELPGLLQYLNNEALSPKIIKEQSFDRIACGGISRFSNELICQESFNKLLESFQKNYHWILLVTNAQPTSAEAENLIQRYHNAAINIVDETLHELELLIKPPAKAGQALIFVINR